MERSVSKQKVGISNDTKKHVSLSFTQVLENTLNLRNEIQVIND